MTVEALDRLLATGTHPASLDGIARTGVALAIWWRAVPTPLLAALAGLDPDTLDDVAVEVAAGATVRAALAAAGYPGRTVPALAADIDALVRRHAALTGEDRLRVRLEVVETDACRRFHADVVTLRLLCTYIGPGTQWCCTDRADAICEVPTGAVGVFKGRLLLDPPTILHRSPPIAATGGHRLVLAIDPAPPSTLRGDTTCTI